VTDEQPDVSIGERIRLQRRRLGMTQKVLADLIGMSERWIVEVENGRVPNLRVQQVYEFARALKIDIAKLTDQAFTMSEQLADRAANGIDSGTSGPGTLFFERDEAHLRYVNGVYRPTQRRKLVNAGSTPITRFLVRISVDRYPHDPERSNQLYREHPLAWDELNISASCEGEPMTWAVKQDRDAFKELYLRFESPDHHHFPLYPGQSTWIEYSYTVGEDKWGTWYQRAVRWPTQHLTVRLQFPSALDPVVWGTETSLAGEAMPFHSPIDRHEDEEDTIFDWSTESPPLHARYRLAWQFRRQGDEPQPDRG
jgi:transcriptional regulator with XRE-family HTH domain